jgi:hypothetical protein
MSKSCVVIAVIYFVGFAVQGAPAQAPWSAASEQACCDTRAPGFVLGVDVPNYPGAKEMTKGISATTKSSVELSQAQFQSQDPPIKIADFYRLEMRKRGWQIFEFVPNSKDKDSNNTDKWQVVLTRKDYKRVDFFVSSEGGKSVITMAGAESAGVLIPGGTMHDFGSLYLFMLGRASPPKKLRLVSKWF